MTRLRLFALISCLLLTVTAGCRGQSVVTPEQAKDAVRAFEGESSLELVCSDLQEYTEGPEWTHEKTYDLEDVEGAVRDRSWTVDAVTGEVTGVIYYDAGGAYGTSDPTGPLTQEQCRQIAEDFARSKCSWFDTAGLELKNQEWCSDGWSFRWVQKIAHGAETPNGVSVDVNPADGRIQMYGCGNIPIPTPPELQITAQQAIDVVKADRGLATVYGTISTMLFASPDGIFWVLIDLTGEDAQGNRYVCSARVDAVTGEIVSISEPWSSPPPAKLSTIADTPVSIRGLAAKVPGASVHWLGKEARLFVGKNRYTLVPGKDTIEWTGGTIKLSQKMKIVDGRLMVPSGLLDILKAAPAPKKAPNARAKSK